jgi:putative transposase
MTLVNGREAKEIIEMMTSRCECPSQLLPQLKEILWKYKRVLAKHGDPVGLCTAYKPEIKLDTDEPIYTPQYLVPYRMRQAMRETAMDFLKQGIVQPSTSPYNSPSLMVPKGDRGYRMVIDLRKLNKHVITDPYSLPRIQQILERLGAAIIFTAPDLLNGFYNLEIEEKNRGKTAFSTFEGLYQLVHLPMGLKNSPSVFQRLMQIILSGCLGHYAFIYIDDILVFSKTRKEHVKHLEDVLQRLDEAGLRIKASKCQLWKSEVEYIWDS